MSIIGNPIMAGGGGVTASIFVTGLSQTDTVTATNGSKTLTGKWTQKPNPAIVVPDGYTQLEYIESTGTQYIQTAISNPNGFRFIGDIEVSSFNNGVIIGSQKNVGSAWYRNQLGINNSGHPRVGAGGFGDANNITLSTGTKYHAEASTIVNNTYFKIDGVSGTLSWTDTESSLRAEMPLYMFAMNTLRDGTASIEDYISIKLYGKFDVYTSSDDSELVGSFIPAKRNSDSAIGLYDLVSGTFFENSGTGAFIAGPEVPQTIDGFLIKPIRDLGTWTVTATNGTKTATQDVLVDVITEYEIEMDYKLWLYRDGDECEDVTGGWSVNDNINWANYSTRGFVSKGETIKLWANSNNRVSAVQTSNPIDLTGFSKLVFRFGNPSGTSSIAFGFASTTSGNINENYLVPPAKYLWDTTTPVNTYELDISSLNGFYYATFAFVSSGSSSDASSAELEYAYLFD